jgi:hypothetical protein
MLLYHNGANSVIGSALEQDSFAQKRQFWAEPVMQIHRADLYLDGITGREETRSTTARI